MNRPIFIAGPPGSGTSLTANILAEQGIWAGECISGDEDNVNGYFENIQMVHILKTLLKRNGVRARSDSPVPRQWTHRPDLRKLILDVVATDGPWFFKDSKLLLAYPLICEAFPEALWILPRRTVALNVNSLLKKKIWAKRYRNIPGSGKKLERMIHDLWLLQLDISLQTVKHHWVIPNSFFNNPDAVKKFVEACGLQYDEKACDRAIKPELWHHG